MYSTTSGDTSYDLEKFASVEKEGPRCILGCLEVPTFVVVVCTVVVRSLRRALCAVLNPFGTLGVPKVGLLILAARGLRSGMYGTAYI